MCFELLQYIVCSLCLFAIVYSNGRIQQPVVHLPWPKAMETFPSKKTWFRSIVCRIGFTPKVDLSEEDDVVSVVKRYMENLHEIH